MQILSEWLLTTEPYASEPDLLVDASGEAWLATAERDAAGAESIALRRLLLEGDAVAGASAPLALPGRRSSTWPSLAAVGGEVYVAWVDLEKDSTAPALLRVRRAGGEGDLFSAFMPMVRHPRLIACGERLLLTWACRDDAGRHRVKATWLHPDDEVQPKILDLGGDAVDLVNRPAAARLPGGRALVVWERHATCQIRLDAAIVAPDGEVYATEGLVSAPGFLQAPTLAPLPDGALALAYSTDVPEGPPPHLPRWTQLARVEVDGADLAVTIAPPPPDMDLEASGEDQSFEFPALCATTSGALLLAARASHNLRVQVMGREGWTEPTPMSKVLWGCRGVRLSARALPGDRVLFAAHDRKGVTVRLLAAPPLGPPHQSAFGPLQAHPAPEATRPQDHARWERGLEDWHAFFGDIHFHSARSDGVGTIEEAWLRCRDRYGMDFACLTDHDAFIGRRVTDGVWRNIKEAAEAFDRPEDGFATLVGIEYTGVRYPGPGHKCVYFDDASAPLVCRWDGLEAPEELLDRVRELGGFAAPHHVGWLGGDPEHHAPDVQPCWEICSAHGQYECPDDDVAPPPMSQRACLPKDEEALAQHYVRRQLEQGAVFGFVGGSDGHGLLWHHGISPRADSHRTGLTGVFLPTLRRDLILDAIRARRTFATTGERLALAFTADGHLMGAKLPTPPDHLQLDVLFFGDGPATLHVFSPRGGRTAPVATRRLGGTWRDTLTVDTEGDSGFLYVRVVQDDGATVWASPVFW